MNFFKKNKKTGQLKYKQRIEKEIQDLFDLKNGLIIKVKEYDTSYYINILIDKRIIGIDIAQEKLKIPNILIFLLIIDMYYPDQPPRLITKSNFCTPTLMDGRDLFIEECPNWNKEMTLTDIVNGIIPFCSNIINSRGYKFYGTFHLGAIYDMRNFETMIVNTFRCTLPHCPENSKYLNNNSKYLAVLSEDCFILFELLDLNVDTKIIDDQKNDNTQKEAEQGNDNKNNKNDNLNNKNSIDNNQNNNQTNINNNIKSSNSEDTKNNNDISKDSLKENQNDKTNETSNSINENNSIENKMNNPSNEINTSKEPMKNNNNKKSNSPIVHGKIVFWSSLFSITDMQLIQAKRSVTMNFFEDASNKEFKLKLELENPILFRDNLVNKVHALKVKLVSQKVMPGQKVRRRLTAKDLNKMKIKDVEKNVIELKHKIEQGEVDDYTVGTFTTLVGRAVEELGKIGDEKHVEYLNMMKEVLRMDKVDKLTENENNEEINIIEDIKIKDNKNKEEEIIKSEDVKKSNNENNNSNKE